MPCAANFTAPARPSLSFSNNPLELFMNPPKKSTVHQQAEEQRQALGEQNTQAVRSFEFATADELLRHDALHTPVPPAIASRLQQSIGQLPQASRPNWWRRLFGGLG